MNESYFKCKYMIEECLKYKGVDVEWVWMGGARDWDDVGGGVASSAVVLMSGDVLKGEDVCECVVELVFR